MVRAMGLACVLSCFSAATAAGAEGDGVRLALADQDAGSVKAVAVEARVALAAGDAERALALLKNRGLRITKAERRSIEGRAHFLLQDYITARRKLRSALRLRSADERDWYWLGRTYAAGGSAALAASCFEKAHWHGLDSAELHYHWAAALADADRVLGQIRQVRWTDADGPCPAVGALLEDGVVLAHLSSPSGRLVVAPVKSAIFQVQKALSLKPTRTDALLLAGRLWARTNHPEHAVSLFAQAAPRLTGASLAKCHARWAESLLALGDFEGYLEHAQAHIQLMRGVDPAGLAACYDTAARESGNRGDLPGQIRYLKAGVQIHPAVDRLIRLADALLAADMIGDAAPYLKQALALKPTKPQRRAIKHRLLRTSLLASPAVKP
ncbi:MAG: hypothetical protein ACE5FS_15555 [Paracoccaceae bacterium]